MFVVEVYIILSPKSYVTRLLAPREMIVLCVCECVSVSVCACNVHNYMILTLQKESM